MELKRLDIDVKLLKISLFFLWRDKDDLTVIYLFSKPMNELERTSRGFAFVFYLLIISNFVNM